MDIKFDKFSRFETPSIYVCAPGCKYQNGRLTNTSGMLFNATDLELMLQFNTTSELNFRVNKIKIDDADQAAQFELMYNQLKNRRLLFLDGIGFFAITQVEEGYSGGVAFKDITAESCEVELQDRNVPYIPDGTYKFYTGQVQYNDDGSVKFNNANGEAVTGIIDYLMTFLPLWQLNDMTTTSAAEVAALYRTFEDVDVDKNILGFMLEDMQDAYECIFTFNTTNRIITVDSQNRYMSGDRVTDIHITRDDFINELNVSESSDNLYTALSVYGVDDLAISGVNPLGGSVVYNFDYYLDWMTTMSDKAGETNKTLGQRVREWQEAVKAQENQQSSSTYYYYSQQYYSTLTTLSTKNAEKDLIGIQLDMYEKCRQNVVSDVSDIDISRYNEVLIQAGIPASEASKLIPETVKYTWIMFADTINGANMTTNPKGKNYIGLAYNKTSRTESLNPSDYSWSTYRTSSGISRSDGQGGVTYTWIKFADSSVSGMTDIPDYTDIEGNEKVRACIGIRIGNSSQTESTTYSDYTWSYVNRGEIGVPEIIAQIVTRINDCNTRLYGPDGTGTTSGLIKEITDTTATANSYLASMNSIRANLSLSASYPNGYFTTAERLELQNYIFEGTYNDEHISITESMTQSQRLARMRELYSKGVEQLKKASYPTQEFTVGVDNFIFVKEFKNWTDQIQAGCAISVELSENDIADLFLTEISVNYDDRDLKLTFGNRLNRYDQKALFNDVLGKIRKSSNTLGYIRDTVSVIRDGTFNKMKEALENSRTLTKNQALSSTNEVVTIDDTGYTGGQADPETGEIGDAQIKITGRNIVFTDDSWETCKTAIGEILLGEGESAYGINGELLMGEVIVGGQLSLIDGDTGLTFLEATKDYVAIEVGDEIEERIRADLLYVKETQVSYALSTSGTVVPTGNWSDQILEPDPGQYLWVRTVMLLSDNTVSEPTYAVSSKGASITSMVEEYAISSSSSSASGCEWLTTMPAWEEGKYIWTRNHIYWNDGLETTTTPFLNGALNSLGSSVGACRTDIEINKQGITQANTYIEEVDGQVAKINAYIKTGVLGYDETGRATYGVKIGENLAVIDAYIINGSTAFSSGWLTTINGGSDPLEPSELVIYIIRTSASAYFGKSYRWDSEQELYIEASSEGTLSSVFTSSELGFYDTGEKTAYFSNKNLNVRTVRTNKVLLSEDVISDTASNDWQIGIDNGFYIKWVGSSNE